MNVFALEFPPVSHLFDWPDILFSGSLFAVNKTVLIYLAAVLITSAIFLTAGKQRNSLVPVGVQHVAEQGGAYWLIDKIFAAQYENINLPEQEFQVWILELLETGGAQLTCHDGDYNWQHDEKINFTDFPLKKITLYFTGNVLLLPSEY